MFKKTTKWFYIAHELKGTFKAAEENLQNDKGAAYAYNIL